MKEIIVRQAPDDFYAFLIAQVMQKNGVDVFSITVEITEKMLLGDTGKRYFVWGKFESVNPQFIQELDEKIEKEWDSK